MTTIRKTADPLAPAADPAAPPSDGALVERARGGDPAAFELIIRRHNRRLYRLARAILRNDAEAEDVVQDTYVRAFEKLAGFHGPDGFASWLCRIAHNEALGRLRRRGRVISIEDHRLGSDEEAGARRIDAIETEQPGPERLAMSGDLRRMMESAIDALPEDFRAVFMLRSVEGASVEETAQSLSIRPETVKTRHHRARRLLQDALGARFEDLMPTAFSFDGERCDRIVATVFDRLAPAFAAGRAQTGGPPAARFGDEPKDPKPDRTT